MFSVNRIQSNTFVPRVLHIQFTNTARLVVFLHLLEAVQNHFINGSQLTFENHVKKYLPSNVKIPNRHELVDVFNNLWSGGLHHFHEHCATTLDKVTTSDSVELSSYIRYNHTPRNPPPTELQVTIKTTTEGVFWFYLLACLPDSVDVEDIQTEISNNEISSALLTYIGTTQSARELAEELTKL